MSGKYRNLVITGGMALALLAGSQPMLQASAAQTLLQSGCETFAATSKQICGRFLTYWSSHGGLAQQGYPISGEMKETSEVDGKQYTVQYFERAVFEMHPENAAPNDVLLSLLGSLAYKQKYPNGATELPPVPGAGAGMTFSQTGKTVYSPFLEYWKSHGGLAQQGYPISNLIRERSDLDGKEYVMQYFERAVFEMHPENKPPFDVLLSQLGTMKYKSKYSGIGTNPGSTLAVGMWGGQHIVMQVAADGVQVDLDCAHASIAGPIAVSNGRIDVMGTYFKEHGGPISEGDDTNGQPAHFTGTVNGNTLTLNIALPNSNPTQQPGPFTLNFGQQGRVVKCL